MSTASAAAAPAPWWRPLARSDKWALTWFVGITGVLFIVPALLGHPAIDADNLIQNFPLRVLVGEQIASGHLPLLNPLTNAGTPLLGGMNAGALYPLTIIFAVVPAIAAWIVNMIAIYLTAAIGVFVLLRWHGIKTWPSFAGGLTYAYSGAMIGQMVHLGVVQGFSFFPWAVVIMLALSRRFAHLRPTASILEIVRVALPWMCAIAVLWGLTFLTGEPRAIADIELLTMLVVPCVLLLRSSYWISTWRMRVAYLSTLLVGFIWSVGIGLVQLLPGYSFISFSQRAKVNYQFFGAGSLAVHWTSLLLAPDVFGGNGAFGQPSYFVNYNLAEVTGYAGVLALVAAAAFLTRLTRRGWVGADRDFTIYLVIGVVGLFAAWGSFTPLGHIFRAIPLFGSTRLQSRNIAVVDFALAVILGWWLQHVSGSSRERSRFGVWSRWFSALPAVATAALAVALLGWGPSMIDVIGITGGQESLEKRLALVNWLHLAIALVAVIAVGFVWRNTRWLFRVVMAVLVADLAVFLIFTSTGLIGGAGPREASRAAAEKILSSGGRFALVDQAGAHTGVYRTLGEPNMNVWTHMASVQGYGSLISTIYDDVTGTHPQAMLNACHLAAGTFTQLRLGAIAISSAELMTSTSLERKVPEGCVRSKLEPSTRRYFGRLLDVGNISLRGVNGAVLSTSPITVRLLNANGRPVGFPVHLPANAKFIEFGSNTAIEAAGFVASAASGVAIGDSVVTPSGSTTSYRMDSDFQLAISTSSWKLTSTNGSFSVFKATSLIARAWFTSPSLGRVTDIRTSTWGDTWVSVTLRSPSSLERSEAYLPGWRATAVNDTTGKSVSLSVRRVGLIQEVNVPRGSWVIHFHYHAPYIEESLLASTASVLLLFVVAGGYALSSRRRRKDKVTT